MSRVDGLSARTASRSVLRDSAARQRQRRGTEDRRDYGAHEGDSAAWRRCFHAARRTLTSLRITYSMTAGSTLARTPFGELRFGPGSRWLSMGLEGTGRLASTSQAVARRRIALAGSRSRRPPGPRHRRAQVPGRPSSPRRARDACGAATSRLVADRAARQARDLAAGGSSSSTRSLGARAFPETLTFRSREEQDLSSRFATLRVIAATRSTATTAHRARWRELDPSRDAGGLARHREALVERRGFWLGSGHAVRPHDPDDRLHSLRVGSDQTTSGVEDGAA